MIMRKWKIICVSAGLLLTLASASAYAEHTREWRQSTYEEFMKGTAEGIAVRSDGKLELAPQFKDLADADASYLWSLRVDPKGNVYAAGGSPAKVFRFDEKGKLTPVFESTELSAQAIAFDGKGALYVGTAPDGKVYRVSPSGEKSVFFDPKTKYIWDLAFGPDGMLYVATGDKGQVFAVDPNGKGRLFYASDEAHIRVLAFDHKGNLIAGTEPNGRILRLTRKAGHANAEKSGETSRLAEGFVLYETLKREVTALAVGSDGSIYAAAIGERQRTNAQGVATVVTAAPATTTVTSGGSVTVLGSAAGLIQGQSPFVAFPPLLTGSIYKISPDGSPEELWSSRTEVVYSLGINADGQLLAGTGNNGAVLAIDGQGVYAQLAKAGASQVTGIVRDKAGKIYLCTANPGKLVSMGPEYAKEGTYESASFDANLFSRWGRLNWWGALQEPLQENDQRSDMTGGHQLSLFVRSGNTEDPGREWSPWSGPYVRPGAEVTAPPARFVQWKAILKGGGAGDGIDWVSLAYQPKNVAPVIDGIAVQDPGIRAQSVQVVAAGQFPTVSLKMPPQPSQTGVVVVTQSSSSSKLQVPPQGYVEKGWQSVLWSAHDENDDDLRYAVYYRGEGQKEWILLKDKLDHEYIAFNTTSLPDGAYYVKIVADDSPSNPPAEALKTEKESDRFVVDNTPPVISKMEATAVPERGANPPSAAAHVTFTAEDHGSVIDRAQYSVDGGDWVLLSPKSGISDAPVASYDFEVKRLKPGEHTIAVRAYDHFDNVGSSKALITVGAAKP